MTTHVVKARPQYFQAYLDGTKPWSLRVDDRQYQDGDLLHVQEWDETLKEHTGREALFRIVKVWKHLPGLEAFWVLLTLEPMARQPERKVD